MSVLIDGVPMPKDCRDCCFKYESDASDRLAYCYISGCWTIPKDSERAEVCLLKETQLEPHWIPCSKRLPEMGDYVICAQENGDVGEGKLLPDGNWLILYESAEYGPRWVRAWMPLPSAYREEGD